MRKSVLELTEETPQNTSILVERENLLNYEEVRDELMNLGDY